VQKLVFFSKGRALLHKGVSKGVIAERIFASLKEGRKQADFVLCIGDDMSDFENIDDTFEAGIWLLQEHCLRALWDKNQAKPNST